MSAASFSQFGEDLILKEIFARIGETNRRCFEIGAMDGDQLCNTKLFRLAGWWTVLIEADPKYWKALGKHAGDDTRVLCRKVEPWELEALICEVDYDFGVIDIDGQDFWMWAGLQRIRPRVMIVEYCRHNNSANPPPPLGDDDMNKQAGRAAILSLGKCKGYTFVKETHVNLIFVRNDCVNKELTAWQSV